MKAINVMFEDKDYDYIKAKKQKKENWREFLLRLAKGDEK